MSLTSSHLIRSLTAVAVLVLATPVAWSSTEFGAHLGAGCRGRNSMAAFEQFVSRKLDRTVDALSQVDWQGLNQSIDWVVPCWKGSGIKLTLSVPMVPKHGGSLREALSPVHDETWRHTARVLVANGYRDATVRLGWEFNGDWMPWAASRDPDAYVALFRHIVARMRAVPGTHFRFEWCPNHGRHEMDPSRVYPGDDVVDVIGMDVYDEIWDTSHSDPVERLQWYVDQPFGLAWHRDFAREHGKPTAYSEWGTGTRPDGHGGGDDPVFIKGMAEWFRATGPVYQSYWDYPSREFDTKISDARRPLAAAAYVAEFGGSLHAVQRGGGADARR